MKQQISNRLGVAHVRDTMMQFVTGAITRQQAIEVLRLPRRPRTGSVLGHCAQSPSGRPQGAASGAREAVAAAVGGRAMATGRDARLLPRTLEPASSAHRHG